MGSIITRRRNDVTDEQIVAAYKEDLSAAKVEKRLGVSQTTIYRVLICKGVSRDGLTLYRENAARFGRQQSTRIRVDYESGKSFAALVKKYGGTEYSIKRAIRRAGGKLVPVTPPASKDESAKIISMYNSGLSQMRISIALNRSQSLISRILRGHGIRASHLQRGKTHGRWKGGRWRTGGGYYRVLVDLEDSFSCMRDKSGYVLEHRLVMARSLGRPLDAHETVHHINGDPGDNRLSNLQLRSGRHGKGASFRCLDCGSHNIEAIRIGK